MITTLDELEDILWEELMSILGYEIDNPAWSINPPVRRSWQQQGQPGWSINDDILFFKIFDESGQDITIPVDTIINNDLAEDIQISKGQTRVLRVNLIAYGPNSYDNLINIRNYFHANRSEILKENKIYLIPSSDVPLRMPELFLQQWWERADLNLRFNCLMTYTAQINEIKTVPLNVYGNASGETVIENHREITKGD